LILLGSTGSIGVNTLLVAQRYKLPIEVLVAGNNATLLQKQINTFHPKKVVVGSKETALKISHPDLSYGEEAILDAIESSKSDIVVNALVGFTGLRPTLKAIACGKRVALANKESLVAAGKFVDTSNLVPIDSEHFALWYLLNGRQIDKMIITASGGAFRDTPLNHLQNATVEEVLKHPNWSMGKKITCDSATMTNKLFELIEGYWLFKNQFSNKPHLDAIIETKSLIHAFIDFTDGSTTAHIAKADMKLPIAFALRGKVEEKILDSVDFTEVGNLEFRKIEASRYPIWEIKDEIMNDPEAGLIINAANEVAIDAFFSGRGSFLDISKTMIKAYAKFKNIKTNSIEELFLLDKEIRKYASTF
jgi:1-deoxy-D-xylulose-5-phosphate reductoisomerase